MTYPDFSLVKLIVHCSKYFTVYLKDKILDGTIKINLTTLLHLFESLIHEIELVDELNFCPDHPSKQESNLLYCIGVLSKTLLNNFTKSVNDDHESEKQHMGIKIKQDSSIQIEKFYQ